MTAPTVAVVRHADTRTTLTTTQDSSKRTRRNCAATSTLPSQAAKSDSGWLLGAYGLGVPNYFTNLDALERHGFGTHRFRPLHHLRRSASGFLGLEHDDGDPVMPVIRTSPVPADEPRRTRHSRD